MRVGTAEKVFKVKGQRSRSLDQIN